MERFLHSPYAFMAYTVINTFYSMLSAAGVASTSQIKECDLDTRMSGRHSLESRKAESRAALFFPNMWRR